METQSDITTLILASYNLLILAMVLKWLLPEIRRWARKGE
jgi:hypothetical protein